MDKKGINKLISAMLSDCKGQTGDFTRGYRAALNNLKQEIKWKKKDINHMEGE